jgi:hypothetical protein
MFAAGPHVAQTTATTPDVVGKKPGTLLLLGTGLLAPRAVRVRAAA